jgi:hypothetical protein
MAIDIAAVYFFCEDEQTREENLELIRVNSIAGAMLGGGPKANIQWDTVEEIG